jgi:hypothetical protein
MDMPELACNVTEYSSLLCASGIGWSTVKMALSEENSLLASDAKLRFQRN